MAFYGALNLLKISKQIITPIIFGHQARCYAMPGSKLFTQLAFAKF